MNCARRRIFSLHRRHLIYRKNGKNSSNCVKENRCLQCCGGGNDLDKSFDDEPHRTLSSSTESESLYVSRMYTNVNLEHPESWWDYANYKIPLGEDSLTHSCRLLSRLGSGKYGTVYKAAFDINHPKYDILKGKKFVMKILKPICHTRINREVKVLHCLQGGPNIVKLYTVLRTLSKGRHALVMEFGRYTLTSCWHSLGDYEIRYYLYQLLRALDYSHQLGIMHRDVKPQNIIIDRKAKTLRLIDWGLAEFYFPRKRYESRAGTLPYKAPELILGYQTYDYSVDMWAFACILAGFLFRTMPFFYAKTPEALIMWISRLLGAKKLFEYVDKYHISSAMLLLPQVSATYGRDHIGSVTVSGWLNRGIGTVRESDVSKSGFHLLKTLLRIDHRTRFTAAEAMRHPYFSKVKQSVPN